MTENTIPDRTTRSRRASCALIPLALSLCAATLLAGPPRAQAFQNVRFAFQQSLGLGESVHVLGDLPELGGGDIVHSVRMISRNSDANWTIVVRLPVNRAYRYRFYRRLDGQIGDPNNGTPLTGWINGSTTTRPIAPLGKRLVGHSTIPNPMLHWRQDGGAWQTMPLHILGAGRTASEQLVEAVSFGTARRPVDFYLSDPSGGTRDPQTGHYATPLDAWFLQDGHVFTYRPAPLVSPHRRDYDPARPPSITSTILGEVRPYRVMLPRGYVDHPRRRYPVVYFHDGSWMFDPGSAYLYTNSIDPNGDVLADLVRTGQMGECIFVGIDWGSTDVRTIETIRARDYVAPGDTVDYPWGSVSGQADRYARFLVEELKPLIDATYRTRPAPDSTFTAGFSFGGVCAMYLGWRRTETFRRLGSFSGSFSLPNFTNALKTQSLRRSIRVYLDSGDDNRVGTMNVRNGFVVRRNPYVLERDLRYYFRVAGAHVLEHVRERLDEFGTFLYPATEEPNEFEYRVLPYGAASGQSAVVLDWRTGSTPNDFVLAARGTGPWIGAFLVSLQSEQTTVAGVRLLVALGDPLLLATPIAPDSSYQYTLPIDLRRPAAAGLSLFAQVLALESGRLGASRGIELRFAR